MPYPTIRRAAQTSTVSASQNKPGLAPFQRNALAASLALALSAPAMAANFDVTVATDAGTGLVANTLSWAILQANTAVGNDTITLTTDVTMTGVMKRLINSNVTVQSDATPRTVACTDNPYRPFFVKSGLVTLSNLNVSNCQGAGSSSGYSGSGAGLGGALFVDGGAAVTLNTVTFANNAAKGGNMLSSGGYGGGGMSPGNNASSGGGGGLFALATAIPGSRNGGYGGTGDYGGGGGLAGTAIGVAGAPGLFGGGGGGTDGGAAGGNGGFGGGGGTGSNAGAGGFGGGGGYGAITGGVGGFGAGAGAGPYANGVRPIVSAGGFGSGGTGSGSGGGMGGAIFVRNGTLTLQNVTFTGNAATGGSGAAATPVAPNGKGYGGAIFICTQVLDTDSNNRGALGSCNADAANVITSNSYAVTFGTGGTANTANTGQADIFWMNAAGTAQRSVSIPLTNGPSVSSSLPAGSPAVNATSMSFTVTFSEAVSGVDASDFALTSTGTAGGTIGTPTTADSGLTWTVPITAISGTGSLRLDLNSSGTNIITTAASTAIGAGYTSGTVHNVDTNAPNAPSVTGPSNGSFKAGQTLSFVATFNEAVTVTGTPRIAITIGSSTRYADYASGSPGTALTFSYLVAAPDTDTDGIAIASPIDLNSVGTIKDAATNNATLTYTAPTLTGVLVDTTAPAAGATPINVSDADTSNGYTVGDVITLNFSEPIAATGLLSNLTVSGGHSLGTGASISPTSAYASSYTITLGTSPTVVTADTLTLAAANAVDAATNQAAGNIVFTLPNLALTAQTLTFSPPSTAVYGAGPITLSASSNSGLTSFTYSTSSASSLCTVSGSTLTITGAGTCSVTATQAGNGTYAVGTATASVVISPASQTISFAPASPVTLGTGPITLSASSTSSLSSFAYSTSSASSICTLSGSTLTLVGAGTCAITATQAGNTNYSSATANANVVISPASSNGACGGAQGQAVSIAPSQNLCTTGTASSVVSAAGGYSWSCAGVGSGTPASCTAPGVTAPGSTTTTTTELVSGAGCRFSSVTPLAPPAGGPGGGVTMPYGVVDFTLVECTAAQATVRMTYSGPVGNMGLWKYGPYPTPTSPVKWYQLTGATVSGNSITFTIVDNGPGDADPAVGVIADPAGPGTTVDAPASIPTLSEWGMILMSGLLGLFGLAQVRRRR